MKKNKIVVRKEDFRHDLDDYFRLSGVREWTKLSHTPFIVLNDGQIELCFNMKNLLEKYPPETEVIGQWKGEWRSDFFHYTIQDLIDYNTKNK